MILHRIYFPNLDRVVEMPFEKIKDSQYSLIYNQFTNKGICHPNFTTQIA